MITGAGTIGALSLLKRIRLILIAPMICLRHFLTWWLAELATLYPRRVPSFRRGTFAVANFDGQNLCIIKETENQIETLYIANDVRNEGAFFEKIDQLLKKIRRDELKLILRISAELGVNVIDKLPRAASRDLHAIIRNRLDHLTPWSAEAVVFETLRVDIPFDGIIQADIVVVPRKTIAHANTILTSIGLAADIIDLEQGDKLAPPTYDLGRAYRLPRLPRDLVAAAAVTLVAALLFGFSLIIELREVYTALGYKRAELNLLENQLVDLPTLNARIQAIDEEEKFLRELRFGRPSSLVAIESLSRVLPDDSWLETFNLTDRNLTVSGYARDVTSLPALIEAVPIFEAARFTSPSERTILTAESEEPIEAVRFSLRMTVQTGTNLEP